MEYVARGGAFECPRIYRTIICSAHCTYKCKYIHGAQILATVMASSV